MADDSGAIQKALNEAGADGGAVVLPPGRYRLDSGIRVPPGVTLRGSWEAPHHAEHRKGTILLAYAGKGEEPGPPLIALSPNSGVKGVTISTPSSALPMSGPFLDNPGGGMHGSVQVVSLVFSYKGSTRRKSRSSCLYPQGFGCPLKIGVHID